MKTFKNTVEVAKRVLPVLIVTSAILGSFPAPLNSNVQIRQEISIIATSTVAASGSQATSSEIALLDSSKYSSGTYYFEVTASTSAATASTISLVNATSGVPIATVSINGTSYTRYRSSSFTPPGVATEYKVQTDTAAVGKKVIAARIVVLQNASSLANTETQIEIGNNEPILTSTATTTLSSPKYWKYVAANWDGSPTFQAEVDYQVIAGVASSTAYNSSGTFTVTLPVSAASTSIQLIGGGGAGGGVTATGQGAPGGAGGQFAQSTTTAKGKTHTLVVGATTAGTAGAAGSNGADSTWDSNVVVAKGGTGGAVGSASIQASTTGNTTGCIGTCFKGGDSGAGEAAIGGTGGGGAGTNGAGSSATSTGVTSATAQGGSAGGKAVTSTSAGTAGTTPGGGGGGGAVRTNGSGTLAGGTGAAGRATTTSIMASTTIAIQEDNGSGTSWSDKAYMVVTSSQAAGTSTRYRVSFTPTDGRKYRIAYKVHDARDVIAIYDAKIIVDQTGGLSNATYASKSLDATTQDTFGEGAILSSDLATLYYVGDTTPKIYQYTLSTPGDLSTATFASKSVSVSSQASSPFGVSFNSDRSSMYVLDGGNHKVFQYTLSSPGDVSTASYASKSFDTSSQTASVGSLAFNSDLSKMYVTDPTNDKVYQYILSTPGDVSTASYGSVSFTFSSQESQPSGIFISANGAKMYVIGGTNKTVYQYTLSTPGDPSTATYDSVSMSASGQVTTPRSLFISSDGTKMYVADHTGNKVYQYTIPTLTKLEPQYLLSTTRLFPGVSLQGYLTSWSSSEWNTNNSYFHQADSAFNSSSVVGIYTSGGTLVTGSQISSPSTSTISSLLTMPSNGDLDVKATTNNNDIYANRILVDVTPAQTTLADATDPGNTTLAPGGSPTLADAFTFQTNAGTDSITAVTVSLGTGAHNGIQAVEITDANGNTTYGTSTTPTTDSPAITLTNLTANTSLTTYKIRITPLSHASMPAVPGATYTVTPKIGSFVGSNTQTGSDTAGTTLTIDNLSPSDVTSATVAGGNNAIALAWTNPADSDLSKVMVVASTSAITFTPTEGTTYSTSTLNGASRVACYGLQTTCADNSTTNGILYYYKIFTTDTNGNWSTGATPTGSPASSYAITEQSYRFYSATTSADYSSWTAQTASANSSWFSVAYGNSTYVALSVGGEGAASEVMTSPDGVNWTTRTAPANVLWDGIAFGNGTFVGVANNTIATSSNGINWSLSTSPSVSDWQPITYGNGLFVALSDAGEGTGLEIITSPDGLTWTPRTAPSQDHWEGVIYGNGKFVAVAKTGTGDRVMTSTDGITWVAQNTTGLDSQWRGVAYGNGLFVAVSTGSEGVGSEVMTSPDGVNWTFRTAAVDNAWISITYGNGVFVATGYGGAVMTSTDGINWTQQTVPLASQLVASTYGNGQFVVVSSNISGVGSIVMTSGTFGPHVGPALAATSTAVTLGTTGQNFRLRLLNRIDGGTYATGTLPSLKLQYATKSGTCDTSFSGETYADVTDSTPISYYDDPVYRNGDIAIATTTDLVDAARNITYEPYRENNNFNASTSVYNSRSGLWDFSLYDNGAAGNSDYCLREVKSTDAQTWTARALANTDWLGMTYGSSTFVAVADVSTNGVVTSSDGLTWTAHNNANGNGWESIAFGTSSAVAVSYNSLSTNQEVERSTDGGVTWTAKTATSIDNWSSVAFGNGIFAAVSVEGHVMYSTDGGSTWTAGTAAAANAWRAVTYGNGLFVAVSSSGTNRVMTSSDGAHWTSQSAAEANSWQSVVYGNGLFVASASGGTHSIMTSPDGVTWTPQTGPTNISGTPSTGMTYGNGLFVTLDHSTGKVATSPDGANWSYNTIPSGTWMSVAYGTSTFVGVGNGCGSSCAMTASTTATTMDAYNNGGTGYLFQRPITILHAKVPNTDQAQFPILIDEQDSWLATSLASGKVQNTTAQSGSGMATTVPADLIFASDSGCNSKLNWEFESYGSTTGRMRVWVQANVSHLVDTVIYECYDNPSISTWQGNTSGTWDQNYAAIYHLPDGTNLTANDSTLNGNNYSALNGTTAATGQIDGAASFNGTSKFVKIPNSNSLGMTTSMTFYTWINANAWSEVTENEIFKKDGDYMVRYQPVLDGAGCAGQLAFLWFNNTDVVCMGTSAPSTGAWHQLAATVSGNAITGLYLDGILVSSTQNTYVPTVSRVLTNAEGIGADPAGIEFYNGLADEVEISNTARSGDWIKTEYNNQSATSTFYTVGSETSVSGAAPAIAEVVTASGKSITQLHYAWRNDDGNESSATFAAAQDTALTSNIFVGDRIRLRFLESGTGSSNNYTYQLEQASSSCTSWIAVPNSATNGTHWTADLSQYFLDGSVTTNNSTLSDPASKSFVAGVAKSGSALTSAISLTSAQFTELEYTIKSTSNITPNTTYCFRLTNAGDASQFTYSQTPQISVSPNATRKVNGGSSTEGSGTGPAINGGNEAGGGAGTSGNSGGEGNGSGGAHNGGNSGGGGGGDTGFLFPKNFFALFLQLPIDFTVDPLVSFKAQTHETLR